MHWASFGIGVLATLLCGGLVAGLIYFAGDGGMFD